MRKFLAILFGILFISFTFAQDLEISKDGYTITNIEVANNREIPEEIITSLVSEHKSKDTSVQYKALEKMREDAKLKFTDTVLEKKYETYKSQYNK